MERESNPELQKQETFRSWCVVTEAFGKKYVRYDASKMPSEQAAHVFNRYRDSYDSGDEELRASWAQKFKEETGYSAKEFNDFMFTWQQELREK